MNLVTLDMAEERVSEPEQKLEEKDTYKIIDIRCSRDSIRFDKDTVDTIIQFSEKYMKYYSSLLEKI